MSYYHWLGKDAEAYEEAIAYRKAYYNDRPAQSLASLDRIEADGFITLHPEVKRGRTAN